MKSASKRISKSFIVILILVALLIGGFLFKYFTRTKPRLIAATTTVADIHPHKKYKRKHKSKKYLAGSSSIIKTDTVKLTAPKVVLPRPVAVVVAKVTPPIISPPPVKQVVSLPVIVAKAPPVKPVQDTVKTIKPVNSFPYATYIHANVTGIVKMRANDQYNSNTIVDIPGNSRVMVLAKGNTYYRVSYNNNVGFIPKWTLKDK